MQNLVKNLKHLEDFFLNSTLKSKLFISSLTDAWIVEDNKHAEDLHPNFLNPKDIEKLCIQFNNEKTLNIFVKELKLKMIDTKNQNDYESLGYIFNRIYLDNSTTNRENAIATLNKVVLNNDLKLDLEFLEKDKTMNNYVINNVLTHNKNYKYLSSIKNKMKKMDNAHRITIADSLLNNPNNLMSEEEKVKFILIVAKEHKQALEFADKFPYIKDYIDLENIEFIDKTQDFALVSWDREKFEKYFSHRAVKNQLTLSSNMILIDTVEAILNNTNNPFKSLNLITHDSQKILFKFNLEDISKKDEEIEKLNTLMKKSIDFILNEESSKTMKIDTLITPFINSELLALKVIDKTNSSYMKAKI